MSIILFLLVLLISIPSIIAITDLIAFLLRGRFYFNTRALSLASFAALLLYPIIYVGMETENDCCSESAAFSKHHVLSVFILIACYSISYFYSLSRIRIVSPIVEVCANSFLLAGIGLNIFVAIHTESLFLAALGNLPGILLLINMLIRNHQFLLKEMERDDITPRNTIESIAIKILYYPAFAKMPVLLLLCLPLMVILIAFLMLFGQKPDSFIRAFTETYKHGFSEWDYMCNNVECGGHYLCSVAANGHKTIVQPQRLGIRNKNYIICNRQLLVSNAFEELLEEKAPALHKFIRRNYNKVGNVVHKYYGIFNNKYISDTVYILMKPAEYFFIFILYTFDSKPENRIARQYLNPKDREHLKQQG